MNSPCRCNFKLKLFTFSCVLVVACGRPTSDSSSESPLPEASAPLVAQQPVPTPSVANGRKFLARATAYFPDGSRMEGGFVDVRGRPLHTLQAYLEKRSSEVSLAMDLRTVNYGTSVRIPELERDFNSGQAIPFRVVDTGGDFIGTRGSRVDVCVDTRREANDPRISGRHVTIIEVEPTEVVQAEL